MSRATLVAPACAGLLLGVLAERQVYAGSDLRGWLPDVLAGWVLIGLGIALLALRRPPGAAILLLIAGFSWFAFDFATTGPAAAQRLAADLAYLHRAPLLALAVALPAGRPQTGFARCGVALAWLAALFWPLWDSDYTALMLVAAFIAIAVLERVRARGVHDRAIAWRGLAAVVILTTPIAVGALSSLGGASQGVTDATTVAYAAGVALAGVLLFSAALLDAPAPLTDRTVALERDSGLRDALRGLLGDPQLDVAVGDDVADLVDRRDRSGRIATPVTVAGEQVALVLHEAAVLDDPATRTAVLAAVGLAAERARLRAEVEHQVEAVAASRRRLLLAEEEERARLAERVARGPGRGLAAAGELLRRAHDGNPDPALTAALERASAQLGGARSDVDALVQGLDRIGAATLIPALERLAARVPVAVELRLASVAVSPEVASALWFVCSEALANAVKHADARRVRIELRAADGNVRLAVGDDGRGGADPAGSGIVGLADRIAALSGQFTVDSRAGDGTRIVAELPLAAAASAQ